MSCTQNITFINTVKLGKPCSVSGASFVQMADLYNCPIHTPKYHKMPMKNFPRYYGHCTTICSFGEKRNSRGESKAFSWDSLKDALKGLRKEKTVQDVLSGRTRQREFGGRGSDGVGNPPRNGGGGGSDGTKDDGTLDEIVQIVMATLAFILVYIYMIRGAELTKLAKDFIKYRLGGVPSSRLKSVMDKWNRACAEISWTRLGGTFSTKSRPT